jgi:hypothetical protein
MALFFFNNTFCFRFDLENSSNGSAFDIRIITNYHMYLIVRNYLATRIMPLAIFFLYIKNIKNSRVFGLVVTPDSRMSSLAATPDPTIIFIILIIIFNLSI